MPLMFDKRDNLRAGHCAVRIEPIFAHSRSDATVEGPTYRYVSLMPLGNIIKHIRSCCPRNFSNRLNDVDSTIQQSDGLRAAYSPPQIEVANLTHTSAVGRIRGANDGGWSRLVSSSGS